MMVLQLSLSIYNGAYDDTTGGAWALPYLEFRVRVWNEPSEIFLGSERNMIILTITLYVFVHEPSLLL